MQEVRNGCTVVVSYGAMKSCTRQPSAFCPVRCRVARLVGRFRSRCRLRVADGGFVVIVASVTLNNTTLRKRPAALAGNGRDGVNQWVKLGNIVTVGTRENYREREAPRLGDEVVL